MDTLKIYTKKGRMVGLTFGSLIFTILGFLFLTLAMKGEASLWIGILGVIVLVFFGLCLIYYIKELLVNKPALMISNEGIIDHSSFIGAGLVKWEEIEGIDMISMSGQLFLSIFTHDPKLIINRSSGVKRWLNKINQGLLPSQVNIPVKNLAYPIDNLLEEIGKRWQMKLDA